MTPKWLFFFYRIPAIQNKTLNSIAIRKNSHCGVVVNHRLENLRKTLRPEMVAYEVLLKSKLRLPTIHYNVCCFI